MVKYELGLQTLDAKTLSEPKKYGESWPFGLFVGVFDYYVEP